MLPGLLAFFCRRFDLTHRFSLAGGYFLPAEHLVLPPPGTGQPLASWAPRPPSWPPGPRCRVTGGAAGAATRLGGRH